MVRFKNTYEGNNIACGAANRLEWSWQTNLVLTAIRRFVTPICVSRDAIIYSQTRRESVAEPRAAFKLTVKLHKALDIALKAPKTWKKRAD
jgi:hypothetical protein